GSLHKRQNGVRQCVSGDVDDQKVYIRATTGMARVPSALWTVDQSHELYFHCRIFEAQSDLANVALKALLQAIELRPVSFQSNTAQCDAQSAFRHDLVAPTQRFSKMTFDMYPD